MIRTDLSHSEYLKLPHVSNSFLKKFSKTPAHGKYALENPTAPTEEMTLGSLEHLLILEPRKLQTRFHIESDRLNWSKKEGFDQRDRVKAILAEGREVIYPYQIAKAAKMAAAIRSHPGAQKLVGQNGHTEITITNQISDVPVKCRVDKHASQSRLLVDLKTTRDASAWAFGKTVFDLRYHVQQAMYEDIAKVEGLDIEGFRFIAVENEPPYCVAVYELDTAAVMLGRETYLAQLELYKECVEFDEWPGYSLNCETLYLPNYAFNNLTKKTQ